MKMVIDIPLESLGAPLYEYMWIPALSHGRMLKDSAGVPIAIPFFIYYCTKIFVNLFIWSTNHIRRLEKSL